MFKMDKMPGQLKVAFWPDPRKENGGRYNTVRWRLLQDPCIMLKEVTAEQIRASVLEQRRFDALFVAGGNAYNYQEALGKRGSTIIHDFVCSGGAYIGECAGAFLATKNYMGLLRTVSVADMDNWCRGKSNDCVIKITDRGRTVVTPTRTTTTTTTTSSPAAAGLSGSRSTINPAPARGSSSNHSDYMITRYCNGPLLQIEPDRHMPRNPEDTFPVFEFASDFCGSGGDLRRNIMPRCAAIVAGKYCCGPRPGRVVLISPHPADSEPAMRACYTNLVRWACHMPPANVMLPSSPRRPKTHKDKRASMFSIRNRSNRRRQEKGSYPYLSIYSLLGGDGDKRSAEGGDKRSAAGGDKRGKSGVERGDKRGDEGGDKRGKSGAAGGDKRGEDSAVVSKIGVALSASVRHAVTRLAWLQNRKAVFDHKEVATDVRCALKRIKQCPEHQQVMQVLQSFRCLDVARMRDWLTASPRQDSGLSGDQENAIVCLFTALDRKMKREKNKTVSLSGHIRELIKDKRDRVDVYPTPAPPIVYGSKATKQNQLMKIRKNFLPLL